jgi:predicted Zn-dependent protease
MAAAGYDPREMAAFFERLDERGGSSSMREEPGDHPDPASRVAAINVVVAGLNSPSNGKRDSAEFQRIRSRLSGR